MKLILEQTTKIVTLNGIPARIWEGHSDSGIAVHCYITLVAVHESFDASQFEQELLEQRKPSLDIEAMPLRLIL
jgi:hypothetical protein